MWSFKEALSWLNSHIDYERKPTIPYAALRPEVTFALAEMLGRPQDAFSAIHIAGTKGKGSTARFCEALLAKVTTAGGYYSPHVTTIRERITVNCRMVEEEPLAAAMERIKGLEGRLPSRPTYFEILTAAAALIHAESGVTHTAYEVGIGGRYDATRIVNPASYIITHIGFDHTDKLGPTLSHIAAEKAAIIRNRSPVIIAPLPKPALDVVLEAAKKAGCPVLLFGRDFGIKQKQDQFSIWFGKHEISGLKLRLPGAHQRINATLAVAAVLSVLPPENLPDNLIREALLEAWLPARLELLKTEPPLLLDGAHNDSSLKVALKEAEQILGRNFLLLFGCGRDKETARMAKALKGRDVFVCSFRSPRAHRAAELADILQKEGAKIAGVAEGAAEALEAVKRLKRPVLVCGSFYLVGEIRSMLGVG